MVVMPDRPRRWEVVGIVPSGPYLSRSLGNSYTVSGTLTPDSTGTYYYAGEYDGYDLFRRNDSAYEIWRDTLNNWWIISVAAGDVTAGCWKRIVASITGTYTPIAPYTGTATVAIDT